MRIAICLICNSEEGLTAFVDSLVTFPRLAANQLCVATNGVLSATRAAKICEARGIIARVSHGSYMKNGIFGFASARAASFALASDCDFIMMADDDFRFHRRTLNNVSWAISSDDALDEAIAFLNDHKDVGIIQLYGFLGGAPSQGKLVDVKRLAFETARGLVFRRKIGELMPSHVVGAGGDDHLFGLATYLAGYDVKRRFGVLTTKRKTHKLGTSGNYSADVLRCGLHRAYREMTGVDSDYVVAAPIPKEARRIHDRAHL